MKHHLRVVQEQKSDSSIYVQFEQFITLKQFAQAEALISNHWDEYLYSRYIEALYQDGQADLVKDKLLAYDAMDAAMVNVRSYAYLQIKWIKAEIAFNEGHYAEAILLFEEITTYHPLAGLAWYALASSYLHEARQHLYQRIALYHPLPDEKNKINKYIAYLTAYIDIIDRTSWHINQNPDSLCP